MSDHESCRRKVCVICIRKATRKWGLSETDVKSIRDYVISTYNINDPDYPCGICNGCYIRLNQKRHGADVVLPIKQFTPDRSVQLRSSLPCTCTICEVAKSGLNASRKFKMKKGRPKNVVEDVSSPKVLNLCSTCLTEIFPGCRHSCYKYRYRQTKLNNLEHLIGSPSTAEKLVARSEGEKRKSTSDSSNSNAKKKLSFTADDMCVIRKNIDLSTRQTLQLAQDLRQLSGSRKAVEPYIQRKLYDQNHQLDEFFVQDNLLFVEEDKKKKVSRKFRENVIIAGDITGLIDRVLHERQLEKDDVLIRIGLDGGEGFLKVCMSIFNLQSPVSTSKSGQLARKFKDSGVKKVFIIGIAPGVQENYINMKKLWLSIGLDKLKYDFTIATDLKLCNILLGMQNHSSMHPCCWCDVDKYNLDKRGKQRTFASLYELFWNYYDAKVNILQAKEFGNVIHHPIIDIDDHNTPVFHKIVPPELHLMTGPTNHLLNELSKAWPGIEAWFQSIHVKKTEYHGGCFEGNECKKILKKVDTLEERCPEALLGFATTFRLFNKVVTGCFASELASNYKDLIRDFTEAYLRLGISVTPKVHAVMYHVEEFCSFAGKGLGPWSEQTSESLHQEFTKCWKKFFVKDSDNPIYKEQFLAAVQHFNSLNL